MKDAKSNGRKKERVQVWVPKTGWQMISSTKSVARLESKFPVKLEAWKWDSQRFKIGFGGQKTKLIKEMLKEKRYSTEIPMDTGDDGFVVNPYLQLGHFSSIFQARWASQVALVVKNQPANTGDIREVGSILGSGRSPGGGHSNPFQYSCLENPMHSGAWRAAVHGVTKSRT